MAKKATKTKEDFYLEDFEAVTEIEEKKTIQPRPKTSQHVIKISDNGQERPKSVKPYESNYTNGTINGSESLGYTYSSQLSILLSWDSFNLANIELRNTSKLAEPITLKPLEIQGCVVPHLKNSA